MSLDVLLLDPTTPIPEVRYGATVPQALAPMARAAGLYEVLWTPEQVAIHVAGDMRQFLRKGWATLRLEEGRCRALAPADGWGTYEQLVQFTRELLMACQRTPEALVRVIW